MNEQVLENNQEKKDQEKLSCAENCLKFKVCCIFKATDEFIKKVYGEEPQEQVIEPNALIYICKESPLFAVVQTDVPAEVLDKS